MKVLFVVQGEGRGHLTQAIAMEDLLRREGHEVVEVLVGKSDARHLPGFFNRSIHAPVKRFLSPNFLPTPANKRAHLTRSVVYNVLRLPTYLRSIVYIRRRIRESGADLVINFYELLTGLTYLLLRPSVPQVSIGHQYLFLHRDFEFPPFAAPIGMPDRNRVEGPGAELRTLCRRISLFPLYVAYSASMASLRLFTRITAIGAKAKLALSFREMPDDEEAGIHVVPPLLRREVLNCKGTPGDYLHGYMVNAGFGENVMQWHQAHPDVPLHFFWDKKDVEEVYRVDDTLTFHQLDDIEFLRYMSGCRAYATTAGFESVCEAMLLGKPLLMVPAHIEQDCNAHDAARTGAGIVSDDFDLGRLLEFSERYTPNPAFAQWVASCGTRIIHRIEDAMNGAHITSAPLPSPYCNMTDTGL